MSAIYPTAMPGGWHLIGRSEIALFDASASASPTLLHPGDLVQFVAVDG
jgi:allophanate hydrolase subunit 1